MQAALTVVGAAVGFFIGGPVGMQIGAMAGGLLGASLGPGTQGPRLQDRTVQLSSYGVMLPICYGGVRIAGNIVHSDDLVESASITSGKGGPDVTQFTYSGTFFVALTDGLIGGFRKVWGDAKLVYDISPDADGATQAGSAAFASHMVVYRGAADQLPSPVIEAALGVGQVSGMRGTSGAELSLLPLGDFGNRLPNLTFEVTGAETVVVTAEQLQPLLIGEWSGDKPAHSLGRTRYTVTVAGETTVSESLAEVEAIAAAAGYPAFVGYTNGGGSEDSVFFEGTSINDGHGWARVLLIYQPDLPTVVIDNEGSSPTAAETCPLFASPDGPEIYLIRSEAGGHLRTTRYISASHATETPPHSYAPYGDIGGLFCTMFPPEGGYYHFYATSAGLTISAERLLSLPAQTCSTGDPCLLGLAQVPGNPAFCIDCSGEVSPNYQYTEVSGSYRQLQRLIDTGSEILQRPLGPVLPPTDPHYDDEEWWTERATEAGISGTFGTDFGIVVDAAALAGTEIYAAEAGSAVLSDIVADICRRAGFADEQFDVSALTDVVQGYKITSQMPARNAIEDLRKAFYFDAVEVGRKVVFVKRGGASAFDIGPDDLAVNESGEAEWPVKVTEVEDALLPATVNVKYEARDADYQVSTQSARRIVTSSRQEVTVELAIVMTDQKAAEVATVLRDDAYIGRFGLEWSTTIRFAHLRPSHVGWIDDGRRRRFVRITEKSDEGLIIRWKGVTDAPSVYVPTATPSPTAGGGSTVRFDGPMKIEPIDTVLTRDIDDGPHFLLAGSGYRPSFRGGVLYRSTNGTDYSKLDDINRKATLGYALTVLGDYDGGNTVDELNSVEVRLHSGQLASISREALLNGGNALLIGQEPVHFQRAQLIGELTYRLSGFLRYRQGSEWARGTHEVNERVVLLDASTVYRIPQAITDLNLAAHLKGVAFGSALADAAAIPFTWTGINLRPLSPANLAAIRMPDGSTLARWRRRSRYSVPWLSVSELPLGEASEQYLVTVLDGAAIIEQQTVTAQEATLGAADTGYELTQVQELSHPAWGLSEVGGALYGICIDDRPTIATQFAERFDASGSRTAVSATLGHVVIQLAHGTTAMYVLAYFQTATVPSVYLDTTVYRLAYTDITATPVSAASAAAGDYQGVAFDGTNLWISKVSTGEILKCDAADLSVLDTFAISSPGAAGLSRLFWSGGYLWIVTNSYTVIKWDTATEAEIDRFTLTDPGSYISDVAVIGGRLYVATAYKVEVFDPDTFAADGEHAVTSTRLLPGRGLAQFGDVLAIEDYPGVLLVDATSGVALGHVEVAGGSYVSGVRGDQLLLGMSPTSSYLDMHTRAYEIEAPTTAPDYGGLTLRVQQISGSVGPGFAAETTIPSAP